MLGRIGQDGTLSMCCLVSNCCRSVLEHDFDIDAVLLPVAGTQRLRLIDIRFVVSVERNDTSVVLEECIHILLGSFIHFLIGGLCSCSFLGPTIALVDPDGDVLLQTEREEMREARHLVIYKYLPDQASLISEWCNLTPGCFARDYVGQFRSAHELLKHTFRWWNTDGQHG